MLHAFVLALSPALAAAAPTGAAAASPSTLTVPDRVTLVPAHAAVRDALARGDAAAAKAALDADPDKAAVPGLAIAVARAAHDDAAACKAAKAAFDGGLVDIAAVALARCTPDLLLRVAAGPFNFHPERMAIAAAYAATHDVNADSLWPLLGGAYDAPLLVSQPDERKAAAAALRVLIAKGRPEQRERALRRLLDTLPEQVTDDDTAQDTTTAGSDEDRAHRLTRGAVLEQLQQNEAVVALLGDLVDTDCEAALLVGKAQRKLRHYAAARAALAKAASAKTCAATREKAQYLEARVARVQGAAGAEKLLSTFVTTWTPSKSAYVDDVLLWLSEVRAARKDVAGSNAALQQIVDVWPDGDMADEARFRLAFSLARQKKTKDAIAALDAAVAALDAAAAAGGRPRIDLRDRARYWRLRLAVFPDLERLDVNGVNGSDDDKAALAAFAAERGTSYYGVVAAGLARALNVAVAPAGEPRSSLSATASVPLSLTSSSLKLGFALAELAKDKGFDDEAAFHLRIALRSGDATAATVAEREGAAFAAAAMFVQLNRNDLAHQTLRDAGLALLPGAPRGALLPRFALSWPRAFAAEIEAAATAEKIPVPLLLGLAREESAFTDDVVSWAGAVGLCQLMPATAKDEAAALSWPEPTTATLLDAAKNARLGAAHLGRRLRGLKHPLLAIGAYNAGPGAVARWMPPPGTRRPVDVFVEDIPVDETRGYIKKVSGSWATYVLLDGGEPVSFPLTVGR